MVERGGGDLLERLGPDLSAAVLRCLDDPTDLVRSASVSQSWHRFVITNGFCKKLCLKTTPEVSCFVRSIEVGGWSDTIKVGPNCSDHWQMLESEHRIFAYLGHRIVSPRFLTEITMESIAVSTSTGRIENMLPNNLGLDMFSSYRFSKGKSLLNFRLSCKFCVVHEIKMQLPEVFYFCEPISSPLEILRFRLGHMRDENATPKESLLGNFVWTYVSPGFSIIETDDFQSFKLQRPVICIDGVLQIEMLSRDPSYDDSQVKAIVCPLTPAFDVNLLDRMGNSILMYFPGAVEYLDDVTAQQPRRSSRRKLWMKERRRKKNR
ncbi:hypothetical protein IEQ34_022807 [Dendrobium chrysotoxum]|uniref:F-box protein n=1 Tax=Dendrobium chrysotoxum TaxID=161865 RepID=A0AAV7FYS1_DENCH|nr:hypothetical protein IEQ34_022807 [Dendrobium chrysotoxum]